MPHMRQSVPPTRDKEDQVQMWWLAYSAHGEVSEARRGEVDMATKCIRGTKCECWNERKSHCCASFNVYEECAQARVKELEDRWSRIAEEAARCVSEEGEALLSAEVGEDIDEDWTLRNKGIELAAEKLLKIAQTGEHHGASGSAAMQACIDAILGLHVRMKGLEANAAESARLKALVAQPSFVEVGEVERLKKALAESQARVKELEAVMEEIKGETCPMGSEWGDSTVHALAKDALMEPPK